MADILQEMLNVTLLIFMAGNLLDMGLKIRVRETFEALGDYRFAGLSILWAFVLCPAIALLLTKILPLNEPYAVGLLFLGMAPCAPFLPAAAAKAGGDMAYVGAFMLLTAAGTIVYMPLAIPLLVSGFSASPWTIAKPLILYIAAPLVAGMVVQTIASSIAVKAQPVVKRITDLDTLVMLGLILWIFGGDFVSAIGTYAIAAQLLFCALVTSGSYFFRGGLAAERGSVLSLGVCTRNIGAAMAPLLAAGGTDGRSIVMCALAVPITIACAFIAARLMAESISKDREGGQAAA